MPNSAVKPLILVVEDDPAVRNLIVAALEAHGLRHMAVETAHAAIAAASSQAPSIVLLDLGLPDMDGTEILRSVRKWSSMPIIVVSARSSEKDKVTALELGADDYITKPFGTQELLARIKTAIRHTRTTSPDNQIAVTGVFRTGGLEIDYDKYRVYVDGQDTNLTQNEFKIVALLGKNAGKVLTYDYIIKQLWGPHAKTDNQILRVNMANIRRKIEKKPAEPKYIFTEVGVGYRMTDGETSKN